MTRALLTAASAIALGLAGCHPAASIPTAQSRLDCPQKQGDLRRVSVGADGKSCAYAADGTEVTLRIVPVKGDAASTLAVIEHELEALLPAAAAVSPSSTAGPASDTARAAAAAAAQAEKDSGVGEEDSAGERATADLPGLHLEGQQDGEVDHAKIDLPGLQVDARDDRAIVNIGSTVRVDADGDGKTIKVLRDVRLRGQAFSCERRGVRSTFVMARPGRQGDHSYVGYEAGGPKAGPLVVAVVKSNATSHDDLYRSIKKLVRRNAGV